MLAKEYSPKARMKPHRPQLILGHLASWCAMLAIVIPSSLSAIPTTNQPGGSTAASSEDYPTLPSGVKMGLDLSFCAFQMPQSRAEQLRSTNMVFWPSVRILTRSQFDNEFLRAPERDNPKDRIQIVYVPGLNQPLLGRQARVLVRDHVLADRNPPSANAPSTPASKRASAEADPFNPPPMFALIDGETNSIPGWPILTLTPTGVWSNQLVGFDCSVLFHEFLGYDSPTNAYDEAGVRIPRAVARQEQFKANLWGGQTMALTLQSTNSIIFDKAHTRPETRFVIYISPFIVNARTGNYLNEKGEEGACPNREDTPPQPLWKH